MVPFNARILHPVACVEMTANEPLPVVIATAIELVAKGDKAIDKAEEFYKAAGIRIAECKARKPAGITWPEFCKKHFSFKDRRADELIMIGDGRKTLEQAREETAKKVSTYRKKSALRNADSDRPEPAERGNRQVVVAETSFADMPNSPFVNASDCDSEEEIRERGILWRASESMRYAKFDNLKGIKRTSEIIEAVKATALAWNELLSELEGE